MKLLKEITFSFWSMEYMKLLRVPKATEEFYDSSENGTAQIFWRDISS